MKFLVTVGLALALLTLESVVVKQAGLVLGRIDVTVVLVAFLALRATLLEGAFTAFTVGYLLDLMSGQPTGLFTFLAVFTFLVGRLVSTSWTCVAPCPSPCSPWARTWGMGFCPRSSRG
jgi:rod shape-determining protein MreD